MRKRRTVIRTAATAPTVAPAPTDPTDRRVHRQRLVSLLAMRAQALAAAAQAEAPTAPHHWSRLGAIIDRGSVTWCIIRELDGDARWILWADPYIAGDPAPRGAPRRGEHGERMIVIASGKEKTADKARGAAATALYEYQVKKHRRR